MARHRWILVLSLIAGCGSPKGGHSDAPPAPCALRKGTYTENFAQRSGDCGALPEQVLVIQSQGMAQMLGNGCIGTVTDSDDNCSVQIDTTCPGANGFHVVTRGKANWSTDGAMGGGILQIQILQDSTGLSECSSSYDVTFVRQ